MAKLITPNFRKHMVEQFVDSFSDSANTIYYVFAAKSTPFDNDSEPPAPENSVDGTYYDLNREIVFGKRITPDDVKFMINKRFWQNGTVYEPYNPNTIDLKDKPFYVVTEENNTQSQTIDYSVFKCLNNNNGSPSTTKPIASETSPEDVYYRTSDGYEWKYMYTITSNQYNLFSTSNYVPILENANVVANSVPGTIDAYYLEESGVDYNSHAKGFIKNPTVAGNNQILSLAGGTNVTLTLDSISGFEFEKVTTTSDDSGVIVLFDSEQNKIQLGGISGVFSIGETITGITSSANASILNVEYEIDSLSANTDFYKNNSIYLRSGTGAGQLRTITEYIVTGDERRILIDDPFTIAPDTTTQFEITPRVIINGDGTGAKAIAIVNTNLQNTIDRIEVIERGFGYSYANVTIVANTGYIDFENDQQVINANTAQAVALLSPKNGHGSDAANELYSSRAGISVEFDQTEANTIPTENDYRKIGIMKEPLFANLEVTVSSTDSQTTVVPSDFYDEETVVVYEPSETEVVLKSYSYDIKRYETVTVDDTTGFLEGNEIQGKDGSDNFVISGIIREVSGNDLLVKIDKPYEFGTFGSATTINLTAQTDETANVTSTADTYSGAAVIINGEDDFNNDYSFVDTSVSTLPLSIVIEKNGVDISNNVTANSTHIDFTGETITPATDRIFVYIKSTSELFPTQNLESGASAEVINRVPNLRLGNVRGDFGVGTIIYGLQSGVTARIDSVDRTFGTFDNRTNLSVEVTSQGTNNTGFIEDEIVLETGALTTIEGYVHSINKDESNTTVGVSLTETIGNFGVSDDATGTTVQIVGQTSNATAKVTGKILPALVENSGEVIYVENIQPIERADTSTERLKLIIEF